MARRSSGSRASSREEDYYDSNQDGADNDPSPGLLGNGSRDEERRMEGSVMAVSAIELVAATADHRDNRWEDGAIDEIKEESDGPDWEAAAESRPVLEDPLRLYLREIGRVGLLTAREERELARQLEGEQHLLGLERELLGEEYCQTLEQEPAELPSPGWRSQQRRLLQEYGREPTPEEIGAAMELRPEQIEELRAMVQEPVSLESPVGAEGDAYLGDFVEDRNAPSPADAATAQLLREQLFKALATLPERESRLLQLRFGLVDDHSRTLEEVGREFGLTRERIRQIEAKALRKLRHPTRARQLKDFLE